MLLIRNFWRKARVTAALMASSYHLFSGCHVIRVTLLKIS